MSSTILASMKMSHERDPAEVIRKDVGDLSTIEIMGNRVLIGIYRRPTVTAGGIHLPDKTKNEEVFQGVVGLVLQVGPSAFKDDDHNKFFGQSVKVGDWVTYRTSDSERIAVHGVQCRLIEDTLIKMKVAHPDEVF